MNTFPKRVKFSSSPSKKADEPLFVFNSESFGEVKKSPAPIELESAVDSEHT